MSGKVSMYLPIVSDRSCFFGYIINFRMIVPFQRLYFLAPCRAEQLNQGLLFIVDQVCLLVPIVMTSEVSYEAIHWPDTFPLQVLMMSSPTILRVKGATTMTVGNAINHADIHADIQSARNPLPEPAASSVVIPETNNDCVLQLNGATNYNLK
jgi:hypothetical protein